MQRVALRPKPAPVAEPERKIKIMMDSGAFSAWNLGKSINLEAYCDFLIENAHWIDSYFNLDVIVTNNPDESAKLSYSNLRTMRAKGLNPIAVYHLSENIDWLKRILDAGHTYIGLGGVVGRPRNMVDAWYELIWSYLLDAKGEPLVKVHALGEARLTTLCKYPWASADSSTWLSAARFGEIPLPSGQRIAFGTIHKNSGHKPNISALEEHNLDFFKSYLEKEGLSKLTFASTKEVTTAACNYLSARCFAEVQRLVRASSPQEINRGFFTEQLSASLAIKEDILFDFFLSGGTYLPTLYAAGCLNILCSYFYMSPKMIKIMEAYVHNPASLRNQSLYLKQYKSMDLLLACVKS